jgi:hypothetical protein
VITGFNTDIQFGGVTYHVQTEDKGVETPLILSLVYVGGAIIAAKRTPYSDLVATGYDEGVLTERLQRQHKLICAAIRAGRVDDLRKMGEAPPDQKPARKSPGKKARAAAEEAAKAEAARTEAAAAAAFRTEGVETAPAGATDDETAPAEAAKEQDDAEDHAPGQEAEPAAAPPAAPGENGEGEFLYETWEPAPSVHTAPPAGAEPYDAPTEPPDAPSEEEGVMLVPAEVLEPELVDDQLYLSLIDDDEFRAGQLATIRVQVGHGPYGQWAAPDASVTIKVLGTSFRPLILSTRTDQEGVAVIRAMLPRFTSGRAAIIIRAVSGAHEAELRRIIHQY